jgi:hypothetical protein
LGHDQVRPLALVLLVIFSLTTWPGATLRAAPRTPEEFVGHQIGADRELADWETIVGYFEHLAAESGRVHLERLGSSTLGRPFLLVVIADEDGVRDRDAIRRDQHRLYHVDATSEEEARSIAAEGRAIVAISMGLHSTEVGASQASMEIAYDLATREDPRMEEIRRRVIVLLVPSMNPDGLDIVVDWYRETVGTPAEGSRPPWLYHPYAGHDNNRDGFFNNLAETALWSKMLYHDWLPQMILDEHQMGSRGPRLFLPPFDDPVSPSVHPLVYSQLSAAGQQTVSDLTARGWTGIATSTIFTGEWPGSIRSTGFWHNMLGILSEVASIQLATPLYFPPGSLRGGGRGLPEYERRANFLQPWEGGWWRLRDIVDLEKDLTWSMLRWAAQHKEDLLYNFYRMNRDAVEAGRTQAPYGYVIGLDQHDPGAAYRLAELLRAGGVEVGFHAGPFDVEGRRHEAGAFVVRADQPFRPFLVEMLDSPPYPLVRDGGEGEVVRPYDVTAWDLPGLLHVRVQELDEPWPDAELEAVHVVKRPEPPASAAPWIRLDGRENSSYAAVNRLLDVGAEVWRLDRDREEGAAGDFLVRTEAASLDDAVGATGAWPHPVERFDIDSSLAVHAPRVGLYRPWGGSMDEGWTRLVLDRFGFRHQPLRDEDLAKGKEGEGRRLRRDLDVILLASISKERLQKGTQPEGPRAVHEPTWPAEHRGGLGGVETGMRLREFVESGGTLVAFNQSATWVVESLGLPVRVQLEDLPRDAFFAPGTLVRARVQADDPLGWGMPKELAVYFARGRSFAPVAWPRPTSVPVRYAEHDVRISGFLEGEEHLEGRPALVDIPLGDGHVVLFGFSPQRRSQTEGTFKLVFNALLRASSRS